MKRSRTITLVLVPSLAAILTACGGNRGGGVCVDEGQTVIDSNYCAPGHAGGHWYYPSSGGYFPLGSRMSGGSSSAPNASGTVRGGIGASGEAASGGAHGGGESGAGE